MEEEQEEMEGEEQAEVVVETGEETVVVEMEAMETMEEEAERTPGMVLETVAGVGALHLVHLAPHRHPPLDRTATTPPVRTADTAGTDARVG